MKKLLLALLMLPAILFAAPVDPNLAQQVAQNFINVQEIGTSSSIRKTLRKQKRMTRIEKRITNDQQFYIFNCEDGDGYVIVAADDIAVPILGYSYSHNIDTDNIPKNLCWWLSEYDKEIKWAIAQGFEPTEDTQAEWLDLSKTSKLKQADVIIEPLIKTEWSQSPWYNSKCPYDNNKGEYCVTGCVATAMAQIMKYWEHPLHGRGSYSYTHPTYGLQSADFENTTYDWSNMPNDLSILSSSTQINAIATLMYHCGVSVNMDYGVDESSAFSFRAENAMKHYFWYSDEARLCAKDDYTIEQWKRYLRKELLLGRPIFYTGKGDGGGHAFICDGYRSDDFFHFNWGWDDQDGYYALSALKPSFLFLTTADYTSNQEAILCLYPKSDTIARYTLEMEDIITLRDSIPYGKSWYFMADISNVGEKKFEGYIYATVYNAAADDIVLIDSLYVESLPSYLMVAIDSACNLPVGKYNVTMQYRDEDTGDLKWVGDDFFNNFKEVTVYNPIEMDLIWTFAWRGSVEHWYEGDSIRFITQINNNEETPFTGLISVKLENKIDKTIYQYFDSIDCRQSAIDPRADSIIGIDCILNIPAGEYYAFLVYKTSATSTWQLVGCADGFENPMTLIIEPPKKTDLTCSEAVQIATSLEHNTPTSETYTVIGYVTDTDGKVSYNQQIFWMADTKNGGKVFESYWGNVPEVVHVGDIVSVTGNLMRYNSTYEIKKGDVIILEKAPQGIDDVESGVNAQKIVRDNQVLILRGEKTYTVTGQEVK